MGHILQKSFEAGKDLSVIFVLFFFETFNETQFLHTFAWVLLFLLLSIFVVQDKYLHFPCSSNAIYNL